MAKSFVAAAVLSGAGAAVLLISLFFPWYAPGFSAWSAFEVLDLLLAALSLAAVSAVASGPDAESPLGRRSLPVLGALALVVVVSQLIDHPPAVDSNDLEAGAWMGFAGAVLLAAGGLATLVRGSLFASFAGRFPSTPYERSVGTPAVAETEPAPPDEAYAAESQVLEGLYPALERQGPIGADDPELRGPSEEQALSVDEEPGRETRREEMTGRQGDPGESEGEGPGQETPVEEAHGSQGGGEGTLRGEREEPRVP